MRLSMHACASLPDQCPSRSRPCLYKQDSTEDWPAKEPQCWQTTLPASTHLFMFIVCFQFNHQVYRCRQHNEVYTLHYNIFGNIRAQRALTGRWCADMHLEPVKPTLSRCAPYWSESSQMPNNVRQLTNTIPCSLCSWCTAGTRLLEPHTLHQADYSYYCVYTGTYNRASTVRFSTACF